MSAAKTKRRTKPTKPPETSEPDERACISLYRRLSSSAREGVLAGMASLLPRREQDAIRREGVLSPEVIARLDKFAMLDAAHKVVRQKVETEAVQVNG